MDIFQRNSMALGPSQVAPISLGQFGLPRPDLSQTSPMNTAGGLPLPDLGQGPAQNFLSPTEINALRPPVSGEGGGFFMDFLRKANAKMGTPQGMG